MVFFFWFFGWSTGLLSGTDVIGVNNFPKSVNGALTSRAGGLSVSISGLLFAVSPVFTIPPKYTPLWAIRPVMLKSAPTLSGAGPTMTAPSTGGLVSSVIFVLAASPSSIAWPLRSSLIFAVVLGVSLSIAFSSSV